MIGSLVGFGVNHYTDKYIPEVIDNQLDSKVKTKVGEVVKPVVEEQVKPVNDQLASIQSDVKEIPKLREDIRALSGRIDDIYKSLIKDPITFKRSLEHTTSGSPRKLRRSLRVAQAMLSFASQEGAKIPSEDFQKIAVPLVDRDYKDSELDNEMWETVQLCLQYWTSVPADEVPDFENRPRVYGGGLDLNAVHTENAKFIGGDLQYNSDGLRLRNVRFINCKFELSDDEKGKQLARAILKSDRGKVDQLLIPGPIHYREPKAK